MAHSSPGDHLWVKEAVKADFMEHLLTGERTTDALVGYYAADDAEVVEAMGFNLAWRWQRPTLSPRFLPRAWSRLTLTVTDVRVERLHDMTFADSIAEGVECETCAAMRESACKRQGCFASKQAYAALWERLHGTGAWADNPWCCALTLTVARQNIDAGAPSPEVPHAR